MPKVAIRLIGALLAAAAPAAALPALAQSELMTRGQELYEQHCAVCHQAQGEGVGDTFPALSGNAKLEDLSLIVTNIHQGKGNMPAFPDLTAEEIAALASYVRNSWDNDFGEVTAEEVTPLLGAAPADTGDQVSIWDGVFTTEQAARGEDAYSACTRCHGRRLNGAADDPDMKSTPPLARAAFLRDWSGRTLATLFEMTRTTMPQNNPASLSDQQYVDIIAYMLSMSEAPAGDSELPADPAALARIVIEEQP